MALGRRADILPRPVPDAGGGFPLRRPAVLLLQRLQKAAGSAAEERELRRSAKPQLSPVSLNVLQEVLSCVFCSPPHSRKPEELPVWEWSWNDQQNNHVSLRPLQEEAAGGGLWGSPSPLWTGRI